jgi:DNA-binding HxlR family transcriptional regulator
MRKTSFARWPCSIARTVDVLGDAWTPLVLRDAFYGARRFEEFQSGLGIARNTLAERLRRLVDEGLMHRQLYQTEPRRYEYLLTDKGRDFFSVLVVMSQWGDRWLAGKEGPPVTYQHEACGHDTQARLVCAVCGEPLDPDNTSMRMGPGYPKQLRQRPDVQKRFAATNQPPQPQ